MRAALNTSKLVRGILALSAAVVAIIGCTERLATIPRPLVEPQALPPETVLAVADVRYQEKDISIWSIHTNGNSVFVTGLPFGFARWNVSANPEVPQLTFAVAQQIDRLLPRWVAPWFASGTVAVKDGFAFLSGSTGVSVMDIRETHRPKELLRYPPYKENTDEIIQDEAYVWSAAVANPSAPFIYAFRPQDYVLTYQTSGSNLRLLRKDYYTPNRELLCCANAATVFGNRVFVAFRSRVVYFDISPGGGALRNPNTLEGLHANYIASTSRYLYISHDPQSSDYTAVQYPRGIYVYDISGEQVAFFPINARVFTVSNNDTHIYAAGPSYDNDTVVRIFRVLRNLADIQGDSASY